MLDGKAVDLEVLAKLSCYADAVVNVCEHKENGQKSKQFQFVFGAVGNVQTEQYDDGQRIEKPIERLASG